MKDFSNCGIWTQDTNIKMQRPIFWATESVEHNLLWMRCIESFVLADDSFSNGGVWTQDSRTKHTKFYSLRHWVKSFVLYDENKAIIMQL